MPTPRDDYQPSPYQSPAGPEAPRAPYTPGPVVPTPPVGPENRSGTTPPVTYTPSAPSWYVNAADPTDQYSSFLNALLPFMSPEDARQAASKLANVSTYSSYATADAFPAAPTQITPQMSAQYLSSDRATNIMDAIQNMAKLTGKSDADLGQGYQYLKNITSTMQRLGGKNGQQMSRAAKKELYGAVQGFKQQASDNYDLAPYASLADYITNPGFSAGPLSNVKNDQYGNMKYASQNKKLYG